MPAPALPDGFVARMRELLGPEAPAFLDSQRRPAERAARANPLKLDPAALPSLLGIPPEPVPWCPEAFFLPAGVRAGDTVAHAAGLCYLQEPSALAVGEALDLRPGQRVLDLAAAPGGKTTLVAGRLGDQGVVVANELQHGRVRALADNLDRWGSWRTVICGEAVERLAARLPGVFDRVLLDAPCSGEGLFRRHPAAAAQWRPGHVRGSAGRQRRLLAEAARLVRPGGVLVYSTCTFAPEENEQQVGGFLLAHPGWELLPIPVHEGFAAGRPDWCPDGPPELARTVRLWPHRLRGEGHFVAKLVRPGPRGDPAPGDRGHGARGDPGPGGVDPEARQNPASGAVGPRRGRVAHGDRERSVLSTGRGDVERSVLSTGRRGRRDPDGAAAVLDAWRAFAADALEAEPPAVAVAGERVYSVPDPELAAAGLRLVRPGLLLGRARPGRFEPAHALAMAAGPTLARRVRRLDDAQAAAWLRGEPLPDGGPAGWTLAATGPWPLGWGRVGDGVLKNHYPRGLRTMRHAHA
jgi:16S rRNA C967 or C1407 C5-methylase (RsmB/RsmF family)/NOL1/NOP2/fmu family ribosome biogenesis protein